MGNGIKLTPKQQSFVNFYIELGNATEAYKRAYPNVTKQRTAESAGNRLLKNIKIKQCVEEGLKTKEEKRKSEGQIRINPELLNKLVELFNYDIDTLTKNIEKVLTKEFLIDNLTTEELKSILKRSNLNTGTRYAVLERAGFKCQCCGEKPGKENNITLHIDHIIPFSIGGKDTIDNLQVLCNKCNASKGNRFIVNHNKDWLKKA